MEPRLGVALVGVGRWGQHWARTLLRSSEVELLWACDPVARRELASHTPWTSELRECLADPRVRAVVLATPLETHAALGLQVLRSGRHLLVEKPATTRLSDLEALLVTAGARDLVVMPNHLLLHHPAFAALERAVAEGAIGAVRSIQVVRISQGNRPDESAWWTLGPHDLALIDRLAPALLDAPPTLERRGHEHRVTLRHGELCAELTFSLCGREKVRRFTVVGARGSLVFDDLAPHPVVLHEAGLGLDRGALGVCRALPVDEGLPLDRVLAEFCARVSRATGTSRAEAEHLLRVVRALERGAGSSPVERAELAEVAL